MRGVIPAKIAGMTPPGLLVRAGPVATIHGVRITGSRAAWVQLDVLDWQFPDDADDADDSWLMIAAGAALGGRTHRRWSFTDACLLIDEARTLAAWLRAAGQGRLPIDAPAAYASLTFVEPVLGFALAARESTTLLIRVFFAAEGVPEWARRRNPAGEAVDLWVRPDAVLDAADEWDAELDDLPPRPGTAPV